MFNTFANYLEKSEYFQWGCFEYGSKIHNILKEENIESNIASVSIDLREVIKMYINNKEGFWKKTQLELKEQLIRNSDYYYVRWKNPKIKLS